MSEEKKILVGKIVAPQGIKGEVRVLTYSENANDFKNLKIYSDKFDTNDFHFIRPLNSNVIIAKISGVTDRTSAENLRGTKLFVLRNDLPELKKASEYYQADLLGFAVLQNDKKIGTVLRFQNFGGGDIMELENGEFVSFLHAKVDKKNKKIYVNQNAF